MDWYKKGQKSEIKAVSPKHFNLLWAVILVTGSVSTMESENKSRVWKKQLYEEEKTEQKGLCHMVGRIQFLFCFCIFNFCIFPVPVILLLSNLHMAKVQQGKDLTCVLFLHLLSVYCPCLCRSQPREIYHSNVLVMPLPAAAIVHNCTVGWRGLASTTNHQRTTIRIVWKM